MNGLRNILIAVGAFLFVNTLTADDGNNNGGNGDNFRFFYDVVDGMEIRNDNAGGGNFGDPRGSNIHRGTDFLVTPFDYVRSPFDGRITRKVQVYSDTTNWKGVEIEGIGEWNEWTTKIFYLQPYDYLIGEFIDGGQIIGTAQDISQRVSGALPHVHIEVRDKQGNLYNPKDFWENIIT